MGLRPAAEHHREGRRVPEQLDLRHGRRNRDGRGRFDHHHPGQAGAVRPQPEHGLLEEDQRSDRRARARRGQEPEDLKGLPHQQRRQGQHLPQRLEGAAVHHRAAHREGVARGQARELPVHPQAPRVRAGRERGQGRLAQLAARSRRNSLGNSYSPESALLMLSNWHKKRSGEFTS